MSENVWTMSFIYTKKDGDTEKSIFFKKFLEDEDVPVGGTKYEMQILKRKIH